MDEKLGNPAGTNEQLITYVKDRPGNDRRYAIDATKINKELGWKPSVTFEEGLSLIIDWYLLNKEWLNHLVSVEYLEYYEKQYVKRVQLIFVFGQNKKVNPVSLYDHTGVWGYTRFFNLVTKFFLLLAYK